MFQVARRNFVDQPSRVRACERDSRFSKDAPLNDPVAPEMAQVESPFIDTGTQPVAGIVSTKNELWDVATFELFRQLEAARIHPIVHHLQRLNQLGGDFINGDDEEIDIARIRVEVAACKRSIEVHAKKVICQNGANAGEE
jgi:hypothetical protein